MSVTTKNTVASNAARIDVVEERIITKAELIDTVNARLESLEAESARLKNELAAKDAELCALKKEIAAKGGGAGKPDETVRRLKAENDLLAYELSRRGIVKPNVDLAPVEDIVDVVYVPDVGVSRFHTSLAYRGVTYEAETTDGFAHFRVPRSFAAMLIGADSGARYVYAGPDDTFTFEKIVGLRPVTTTVPRHVLDRTTKGEAFWIPVEVVESKDRVD